MDQWHHDSLGGCSRPSDDFVLIYFYYFDVSSTDAEPDTATPSGTPSSTTSIASVGQTKELDSAAEVPTVQTIDSP